MLGTPYTRLEGSAGCEFSKSGLVAWSDCAVPYSPRVPSQLNGKEKGPNVSETSEASFFAQWLIDVHRGPALRSVASLSAALSTRPIPKP